MEELGRRAGGVPGTTWVGAPCLRLTMIKALRIDLEEDVEGKEEM
jgi:hypothetical protein